MVAIQLPFESRTLNHFALQNARKWSHKNAVWCPCNSQIRQGITLPDDCSRGHSTRCCVCKCALIENVTSLSADWGVNTLRTSPLGLGSYSKHSVCLRPFCSADEGQGVLIKIVPSSPGECLPSEPIEMILLMRTGGTFSRKKAGLSSFIEQ